MFDGKTFLPVTGMPMRKMACMSKLFALADPVPLTVPILNAKSLTRDSNCSGMLQTPGIWHEQLELSHVPRGGRTPLGAQAAVEAHVLILDHDPLRLRYRLGPLELLREVRGRGRQQGAQVEFVGHVVRDRQTIHRTDVDAGVALDAE